MIVVPVYDLNLAPEASLYMATEQLRSNAGSRSIVPGERVILIVARENIRRESLNEDSFYPIGLAGVIQEVNAQGYTVIRTLYRVDLESVALQPDRTIRLMMARRGEVEDLDAALEQEKLEGILQEMRAFAEGAQWKDQAEYWLEHIDTIATAFTACSPWMKLENAERYAILAEDSRARRAEMIERALYDFLEVGRITKEAASSQQQEYQRMYRESAIRRQMEHLQKELDEMHPENVSDVRQLEERVASSGMNDTARREAEKVLKRLKQEGAQSVEAGMLRDYLDFLTGLSWKKEPAQKIDLGEARRILDEDHYGLKKVKERILQQIAVMDLKGQQAGSILLFTGAPGTGKTSVGRSIARALGRKYVRVSLGGVHDESDIRGHRRTYIGAMPGRIMDAIHKSGVSNPVMVLDEVDKLSSSFQGSPASALLEVLDPEQNNTFTDHYMNVPYDLSDVLFICTANSTDTIPAPLLDRMEVIPFSGYTPREKLHIAQQHLVPKALERTGIPAEMLSFEEAALEKVIEEHTMEAGVRGLRQRIDALCRALAVRIQEHPEEKISVCPDMVGELLEDRPVRHEEILPGPQPGVVTGLAWTPVGGEVLFVETLLTEGHGEVTITGQLGDVMKESARIALSLVKSLFPQEARRLKESDLHIHVPAGAVPKDGPSAGVTLTTALASLLTGRAVDPHVAMTGEVALRGEVLPIGGLPEKLMAAQRAGATRVLIPRENVFDLKDVPEEVRDKLEIVPVHDVTELLCETGILERAARTA